MARKTPPRRAAKPPPPPEAPREEEREEEREPHVEDRWAFERERLAHPDADRSLAAWRAAARPPVLSVPRVDHAVGAGLLLPEGGPPVALKARALPARKVVVGLAAAPVSVPETSLPGTLCVPLSDDPRLAVEPASAHLFRWDPDAQRAERVEGSVVDEGRRLVAAFVRAPGLYFAVGRPSDPGLRALVDCTAPLRPLADASPAAWNGAYQHVRRGVRAQVLVYAARGGPGRVPSASEFDGICPPSWDHRWPAWDLPRPDPRRWPLLPTWSACGPERAGVVLEIAAVSTSSGVRLYALTQLGGLWTRLDLPGEAWAPLTDDLPTLQMQSFAVSPASPSTLFVLDGRGVLLRSLDGGATWLGAQDPPTFAAGVVHHLRAHPTNPRVLLAAAGASGLRELTFTADLSGPPSAKVLLAADVSDALYDPKDPSVLFAGVRGVGVQRRKNNAWSVELPWSNKAAPADAETHVHLAAAPDGSALVATVGQECFLRPRDTGAWRSLGTFKRGQLGWTRGVALSHDGSALAGGDSLWRWDAATGTTKQFGYNEAPHPDYHDLVAHPSSPGTLFAASDGGVQRSTDHGATWSFDDLGLAVLECNNIALSGPGAMVGANHWGLFRTGDLDAEPWSHASGYAHEWARVYEDPQREGVYFSVREWVVDVHKGTSWDYEWNNTAKARHVVVDARPGGSKALVALGAPGRVQETTTRESAKPTFHSVSGLQSADGDVVRVRIHTDGSCWALTASGALYRQEGSKGSKIVRWVRKTVAPAQVGSPSELLFDAPSGLWLVLGRNGLAGWHGASQGWSLLQGSGSAQLPVSGLLSLCVAPAGAWFVGGSPGVYRSRDGGAKWYALKGLPNAPVLGVAVSSGTVFAATQGRGVFRRPLFP